MRSLHNNLRLLLISGNRSLHQKMMFRFHHHHQLLLLLSRQSLIKPLLFSTPSLLSSSLLHNNKWYSQRKDANDNDDHEIGVKARSTADEFARVAKEKVGSVSQSVEDAWEGTIESVTETVEKGEPDVESVKNKHEKSAAAKRAKVEKEK